MMLAMPVSAANVRRAASSVAAATAVLAVKAVVVAASVATVVPATTTDALSATSNKTGRRDRFRRLFADRLRFVDAPTVKFR